MATRRQIREAFYAELESAASTYLSPSDISQEYPNDEEELPAIVHNDNYRPIPLNNNSAPVAVERDAAGVQTEIYSEPMQARFSLLIVSDDEQEKEDLYEAVRSHFGDYQFPIKDESTLQTDVFEIEVEDSNSEDSEERDPPARGDRLAVNVSFERFYTRDTTPVEEVNQNIDADDDGTDDITKVTTTTS